MVEQVRSTQLEQLRELVSRAGGSRKAAKLIEGVKGYAPHHSALYKTIKPNNPASTPPYVMQCYIEDLTKGLGL